MNAPTKVICSNCGYATNEDVGEDGVTTKVGRCCENLPAPYEYNSSAGTYSLTREDRYGRAAVDHTETDEEADDCSCPDCVESQVGDLTDETRDELWELYERTGGAAAYDDRIRALGW